MWKHCRWLVCAIAALVLLPRFAAAQDPTTQPLVQFTDLVYAGAFRLPRAPINGDDLSIGGKPFAFNPVRNSLFVGSRIGRIAEVSIPELNKSTDVNTLWFGSYLQGLYDPLEGNLYQIAPTDAGIEGILVQDGKLFGTAAIYYDANNTQRVGHYTRSTDLASRSFLGFVPVWQSDHQGYVSGYMATVPPEWQQKLGGRAVTGQCCTPIAWKTSWGPSAFAFNPDNIGGVVPVAATPLLYYSNEHPTLGIWDGSGQVYSATVRMSGLVLIQGTRTALYFGSIGTGTHCYGNGTSDPALDHKSGQDGTIWCYDPTNTDKGSHAFPYRYQIWAYDLNDFAAVKEGKRQPWEVRPYGVWPFELPLPEMHARLGGVGYDAQRQVLYLSQMYVDTDGYANRALIHALKINGAPATLAMPVATKTPPSGSGLIKTIALTANKVAPQAPGTTITFRATATGGVMPYEYQWWVNDGSKWTTSAWSGSNSFNWTPTVAGEYARVAIRVRSYASLEQYEQTTEMYFPISGSAVPDPAPSATATAVALTANLASPQAPGTNIIWTAVPTGGVAPHQYQWWIYNGSWAAATAWTAANTFTWQPASANANYRVAVWVRSAGSSGSYETSIEETYPIAGLTVAPPPPPAPVSTVTAVSLAANLVSPQPPNTIVTWTATPTGGVAPQQYQWWVYNGSWTAVTAWTTANTFTWQPANANASYRVAVWVRSNGNTGSSESSIEKTFPIAGAAVVAPPPPPPPASTATSVALTANLPSPQAPGTSIVWTAVPTGGVAPHQYQWWIYNGSWTAATAWTASNTFLWQPPIANANYRMAVWVRSSGSSGSYETSIERSFPIFGVAIVAPPPPVPGPRASSVALAANLPSPQLVNTTITWTATVAGGTAPYQFQWWTYDGANWTSSPWTASKTFAWRPTVAGSSWRVAVWVRSAGNTTDHETSTEQWFSVKQ